MALFLERSASLNFKVKILMLLFAVSIIVCSIPIGTLAAQLETIETSSVESDLEGAYGDLSAEFPKNETDTEMYLISLMEYGYSELKRDQADGYNIYLYVYNPSGMSVLSDINKVMFASKWKLDDKGGYKAAAYKKLPLKLLDCSDDNTLLKFVVDSDTPVPYLSMNNTRQYDVSGIEVHDKEYSYKDYTVGYSYIFSGYGKGLSSESVSKSTLACKRNSLTTIKVDAHQVSYLSGDSSKGAGYSNQINSAYFSIPSDIENKYGNLYAINYEYYHYYSSPIIVTNNQESYDILYADRGKIVDDSYDYNLFYTVTGVSGNRNGYKHYYYVYGYFEERVSVGSNITYYYKPSSFYKDYLSTVFYRPSGWERGDVVVTATELESYFKNYNASYHTGKLYDYSADLFEVWTGKNHYFNVENNIDDSFSLESYKDTHNVIQGWLSGVWNLNDYDNSIKNARYIQKVDDNIRSEGADTRYLVDKNYLPSLRSFYNSAATDGDNVYLLRYGIADDYYSLDLTASGLEGDFLMCQGNVYLNFDFISFTFKDGDTLTVLACVSDPTDGFFNVTDTTPKPFNFLDIIRGLFPNDPDWWKKLVAIVLVVALGFCAAWFVSMGIQAGMLSNAIKRNSEPPKQDGLSYRSITYKNRKNKRK